MIHIFTTKYEIREDGDFIAMFRDLDLAFNYVEVLGHTAPSLRVVRVRTDHNGNVAETEMKQGQYIDHF